MEKKKRAAPKEEAGKKKEAAEVEAAPPKAPEKEAPPREGFPVVGIGASAGGLEAYQQFFEHMPADSGMAFVLLTHLDPRHPSMLSDILSKHTKMSIVEAEDGTRTEPNHVYVIPPDKRISIIQGILFLLPREELQAKRLPIDFFLRSLADDQGENGVGVILSGTGTDGSEGIKAIYEKNGLTVVQDPSNSSYDGMPRSAIRTGVVDIIAPAGEIPGKIIEFLSRYRPAREKKEISALPQIINIVRAKTGHDFAGYKKGTLARRVEKRMVLHKIEDQFQYIRYLQENPREIKELLREFLIPVTTFFRDPKAFAELKAKALPMIVDSMERKAEIRAWVPGCSTGEEAFSIAILIREYLEEHELDIPVQIFATDISEEAISIARSSLYPESIAAEVEPERLKKYFVKEDNSLYRVKPVIREMVVFAVQNVVQDVPYHHLDLISCRNLLIYLEPELQNEMIPRFHYSLDGKGILFLGTAEGIGRFNDLYSIIDRKWKIYAARDVGRDHGAYRILHRRIRIPSAEKEPARETPKNIADIFQKELLNRFAPVSLLVNNKYEIVYVQGDAGKYLRISSGEPSKGVLDLAREDLKPTLSSALYNVFSKGKEVVYRNIEIKVDGTTEKVNVTAKPLSNPDLPDMALIAFESAPAPARPVKAKKATRDDGRARELEEELTSTRETLKSTIEEMQTSSEEQKSMNEELQSANEELQSTNEELESSKEELQSVNEELSTLNSEMQAKVDQLVRAESDFKVLLDGTKIGIIFLDNDLRIKRFTETAGQVFNLIPTDVGRLLFDLMKKFRYEEMYEDTRKVITTLVPTERQIKSQHGEFYLLRIVPYRTVENIIDGVVITFTNISDLKKYIAEAVQ